MQLELSQLERTHQIVSDASQQNYRLCVVQRELCSKLIVWDHTKPNRLYKVYNIRQTSGEPINIKESLAYYYYCLWEQPEKQ